MFLPYMGMVAILVMSPGPFDHNFVSQSHGGSISNLASISLAVSQEKKSLELLNLSDLGPKINE